MEKIPLLGLAGFSGSGKTTLLEKLLPALGERGLRVAVVKHHHGPAPGPETPEKDTWRLVRAGAVSAVLACGAETLEQALARLPECDFVLVEGYKSAPITKLGLCRRANGKGFTAQPEEFCALVTDGPAEDIKIPCFPFEDVQGLVEFMMKNMDDFTHFNAQGRAKMVDVGAKDVTRRTAVAAGRVLMSPETLALIRSGGMKKGDVLTVAQIAGIMGAKRTPELIPMCHPTAVDGIDLCLTLDEERCAVEIRATVSCAGRTGVEMEALTAVSAAALTVYDMCKAVQKDMVIGDIRLLEKTGGVHGDFHRGEQL